MSRNQHSYLGPLDANAAAGAMRKVVHIRKTARIPAADKLDAAVPAHGSAQLPVLDPQSLKDHATANQARPIGTTRPCAPDA